MQCSALVTPGEAAKMIHRLDSDATRHPMCIRCKTAISVIQGLGASDRKCWQERMMGYSAAQTREISREAAAFTVCVCVRVSCTLPGCAHCMHFVVSFPPSRSPAMGNLIKVLGKDLENCPHFFLDFESK